MSVISIAMTGVRAAAARLEISAENVALAPARSPLPAGDAAPPVKPGSTPLPKVYRPVRANLYSLASSTGGGVAVTYRQLAAGYFEAHDPAAEPGIDLAVERREQIQAAIHYRLSLQLVEIAGEMEDAVIDLLA